MSHVNVNSVGVHISKVPVTIHVTVAVASPVLPAGSLNSNTKDPFSLNVYVSCPRLFVMITHVSLNHVKVAITFDVVYCHDHGLYSTVAVGGVSSSVDRYNCCTSSSNKY